MVSWSCSCWTFLWLLLVRTSSSDPASPPSYTVHHTSLSFDQAVDACSPGVLTTIATDEEATEVLASIKRSLEPLNQTEFFFWVGLKKDKRQCVVLSLPLRGFEWLEKGHSETLMSRWMEEPKQTCTTALCAVLKGEKRSGFLDWDWGLIPVSCKTQHQFICKTREGQARVPPPRPAPPEPKPPTPAPEPPRPSTTEPPRPRVPDALRPTPGSEPPRSSSPEPETPEPATQQPDTAPTEPERPQGPASGTGSKPDQDPCVKPVNPDVRSLTLVSPRRVLVECWSPVKLELQCSGHPEVWRLQDGAVANLSAACEPCSSGFHKDAAAKCIDVDECSEGSAPCRHTCLNTEGSYRCVCTDQEGAQQDEASATCVDPIGSGDSNVWTSGILVPVLAAVGALLLLLLLVALLVVCLRRRKRRRARDKEQKMAMKSKEAA